jgi:hypothetical protein
MAKQGVKSNPMLTRTGKKRLGPLNLKQLQELLEGTSKPKEKAKIRNRISTVEKRQIPQNIGSDVPAL